MRLLTTSIVVALVIGGLLLAYRRDRSIVAPKETQASPAAEPVIAVQNRTTAAGKMLAAQAVPGAWTQPRTNRAGTATVAVTRSGYPAASPGYAGSSREALLWTRRTGKPGTAPNFLPRDSSIDVSKATLLSKPTQTPPLPLAPASPAGPAGALVAVRGRQAPTQDLVADDEYRVLLKHAQFLIRAGLAPMAKEPLQEILRGAPNTPIGREARLTLDAIRN
jgi:hypothetical protein